MRPLSGGNFQLSLSLSPYPTLHIFCVQLKSPSFWSLLLFQMTLGSRCFHISSDTSFLACIGHLTNWPVCLLRTETMVSPSLLCFGGILSQHLWLELYLQCCLLPILLLKRRQDILRPGFKMSKLNQNRARMF